LVNPIKLIVAECVPVAGHVGQLDLHARRLQAGGDGT